MYTHIHTHTHTSTNTHSHTICTHMYHSFNMVMAARSFSHLHAVFEEYSKVSKNDIEKAIKKEMSGDLEAGMLAIGNLLVN